ncbi:TonB-dependent receptor [Pseudomarimonas arenosa]|uniref:TonB-dependent receptor n=1 Tax=Pseudomarimonas arenosa TaxID=2774145 RepID=A0AAW3ZK75_9GAMM|nr:TonB-dependent receptor [Pseudomarimonas arenosa]MBD8524861.1 TonB-dependent receptor [Pseudomarimonas arenosa]
MICKHSAIASAIAMVLSGASFNVNAQSNQEAEDATPTLDSVEVRGIRSSLEKSIAGKRDSDNLVEVITAEDVGKMPDKNVADSLQRVPGVTTQSQSGGSGGFDENDRVSLRGTNPSLTQTLINGHSVASGDWFVLDQVGLVGRSVSYAMLPSEIVGQVVVRKSATADLTEGGVAGSVDIITRKPLDFGAQLTVEGSVQAVYADLPDEIDPQISALFNWKNDNNTFGVLLQAFSEKRHLRRDGQEILGYAQISPTSALAQAEPALANVYYPTLIGSALFEQERHRKGGLLELQLRPNDDVDINLSLFNSKLDATNYNRNWMFWGSRVIGSDNRVPDSYTVRNGTLTSATWANVGTPDAPAQYAIVDNIYRPGANSRTRYADLDVSWRATDTLELHAKAGTTKGNGDTPKQAVFEGDVFNTGASYAFNGISGPADVAFPNGNVADFTGTRLDWIFGASPARTVDKEDYAQFDGDLMLNSDTLHSLAFGLRWAEHERSTQQVAQGPLFSADPFNPDNLPNWNGQTYPGDFGDRLGGNFPRNVWQIPASELERWGDIYSNRDPVTRQFWPGEFALEETSKAAYAMLNFGGERWSGNAGLRFVRTEERVRVNVAIPGDVCAALAPCPDVPGAITTSAFGSFYQSVIANDYNDVLPSANFRFDVNEDVVARLAVSRTLSRPDFSALGGALTADDTTNTGNGGNPNLSPITSDNFDAAIEWYYSPRSLVSATLFYMDLHDYVSFGTYQTDLLNIRTGQFETYTISAPVNADGKVQGLELNWQTPIGEYFGLWANYTYADAEEDSGDDLVGASKNTYNLGAYFENDRFNARVAYTYRSDFFVGLDRSSPQYQDETDTLSASLSYRINDRLSLHLEGLNLNDPILKYYGQNEDQPRAFYSNGRQYYFGFRFKL